MLDWLLELHRTSPVAYAIGLIALVCAAGMSLGSVKYRGIGLGSSGVLFAGILAAQVTQPVSPPTLALLREFGLTLFIFALGLQLGPGFFASLRKGGLQLNLLAAGLVVSGGLLALVLGVAAGVERVAIAGLFAGASTNIPALGAAQQALASMPGIGPHALALPALACAVAYPTAILGSLGAILVVKRLFRIDPVQEADDYLAEQRRGIEPVVRRTLLVRNPAASNLTLAALRARVRGRVVVSRIRRAGHAEVEAAHDNTTLHRDDTLLAVGTAPMLDQFEQLIGEHSEEDLLARPGQITFRRIAVTQSRILGKTVEELGLQAHCGVEVTRITRGDVEMTAIPGIKLQFGDVLQVVGTEAQLFEAANLLGDSLKLLQETHFIPLFAGIFLGVLAGSVPLVVPGLANPVRLGLAGGPLLVALALGRIGHIRGLVWHMPRSANHAFREFGIAVFFAALGLAAGDQFFAAVVSPQGLEWLALGMIVTLIPLLGIGIWARAVAGMNFVALSGLLAGGTTNPPALSFAANLCQSEAPALAYATVYPLTTVLRILVAQLLALLLCG